MLNAPRKGIGAFENGRRRSARGTLHACAHALLLAAALLPLISSARADDPGEGLFITVQNPIDSAVTSRIKKITNRALERFQVASPERPAGPRRAFRIVYDFNPKSEPSGSADFGACYDLSKYLLGLQDVTTVAFVHNKVTRHTVLPVLSCKEIILSKEARLGDVAEESVEPLGFVEEGAYKEVAKRRNLPEAIVLKMLKRDMIVLEGRTLKGSIAYLDEKQQEEAKKEGIQVLRPEPVRSRGKESTLYTATDAQKFGLCQKELLETRPDVAAAYNLPASSLREDPLLEHTPIAWRAEVRGEVNGAMKETLERGIRTAIGKRANLIFLELHCGGGDTQAALDLAKFLSGLMDYEGQSPVLTVAYIPERAPDTAVYIALGCSEIIMHKDATIGDFTDVPFSELRLQALEGLFQSQGYRRLLAQAMMKKEVSIYRVESRKGRHEWHLITGEELEEDKQSADPKWQHEMLIKKGGPDGDLLILKADEALKLGLARRVVGGWGEVTKDYGVSPEQIRAIRSDWLDKLAEFLRHPFMAVLLVMIGITCLILELKIPGVGLPGVVAALCFVLFFWSHPGGQVTILAILLFILGLILIGMEIFVLPGFGVPGISGIVLVFGSLGLVAYGHWPQTPYEWVSLGKAMGPFGLSLVGAIGAAVLLARYLPSIPYVNRLILKPQSEGEDGLTEESAGPLHPDYSALLGAIGVAATPLRPAGKAKLGDEFIDVIAEGSYVVPGSRVQVIEIEGNRIVVKEV